MAFASRSKRCRSVTSSERCGGSTLMATVRSRRVSRARYTSPIPPAPMGARTSYGPRRVPAVSAIGWLEYIRATAPAREDAGYRRRHHPHDNYEHMISYQYVKEG